MLIERTAIRLPRGRDIRAWKNGDGAMPAWVQSAAQNQSINGTFLLQTSLGQYRVQRGQVVIRHAGELFACDPEEANAQVEARREQAAIVSSHRNLVGPGKSLRIVTPRMGRKLPSMPKQRTYAPTRGAPPSIEWIAVGDLQIDTSYQRSIENDSSRRLIENIAARWDWRLCMPLAVSRRAEGKFVIDGQHRHAAAMMRGDIPHLPCCIATYEDAADEACMFVAANRARRAINRLDDFHAALVAGDEDAAEVREIITRVGLTVARRTGSMAWLPGEVAFTSSVQTVLSKHGEQVVEPALRAIAEAFPGEVLTQGASLFLALTRILVLPSEKMDHPRLWKAVRSRTMAEWGKCVHGLKGGDLRAQAMRQGIMEAYGELAVTA